MKKNVSKINLELIHIIVPASVIFLALLFFLKPHSAFYLKIIVVVTALYLGVSFIHHYFDKSLNKETFLEYLLIAFLVLIMIAGVTL
jgi:hypothetical protein